MTVNRTLFGEWCLIREWGRIGANGGRRLVDYVVSKAEAETELCNLSAQKCRRGYQMCKL